MIKQKLLLQDSNDLYFIDDSINISNFKELTDIEKSLFEQVESCLSKNVFTINGGTQLSYFYFFFIGFCLILKPLFSYFGLDISTFSFAKQFLLLFFILSLSSLLFSQIVSFYRKKLFKIIDKYTPINIAKYYYHILTKNDTNLDKKLIWEVILKNKTITEHPNELPFFKFIGLNFDLISRQIMNEYYVLKKYNH